MYEEIRTHKIERIEAASLTMEEFTVPESFDEQALLDFAWGIWSEDREPESVRLRFFPGMAAVRLRESIWHRTQEIEELPDGGCIWKAELAEWREMVPWVRGWGAEVEVMEPEGLRDALIREIEKLNIIYQME
jgi:CRISPR-associated endonuclease/helicase Cas3